MPGIHTFACAVTTCLVLLGCGNGGPDDAREAFGRAYSCPEDRVHVSRRDDIEWSTVLPYDTRGTPPPEVKKDPARLAKWQKDQDELYAPLKRSLDSANVFEARGCGHDSLVGCIRAAKHNGPGSPVNCQVASKPLPK